MAGKSTSLYEYTFAPCCINVYRIQQKIRLHFFNTPQPAAEFTAFVIRTYGLGSSDFDIF